MKKLFKILVISLVLVLAFGSVYSSAYVAYDTYTYSISGETMKSPTAYSTNTSITSVDMGLTNGKLSDKQLANDDQIDIVTDENGNVYIADAGNNRIVVLNKYYKVTHIIDKYYDDAGREVKFNHPEGLFVTNSEATDGEAYLYVCDTRNKNIVIYDENYNYLKTLSTPENKLLDADAYEPTSIAVDKYGRIFVNAGFYEGVVVLSSEGDFTGFIGAQKVKRSFIEAIWSRFQTREQRQKLEKELPIAYNNLTVDSDGFIYVTADLSKYASEQIAAIKSKSPLYSPVKKLNSMGNEIMQRNGFFDPGGEVDVFKADEVSTIIDVALGPEGTWTILDSKRARLYTYDDNGNLLFAFSDGGGSRNNKELLGNSENPRAITYQTVKNENGEETSYILLLDRTEDTTNPYKLTVFAPTEYCETILKALGNQNKSDYNTAIDYWQDVLTMNNNFDLAYIGIGKAYFGQREYAKAYEVLQNAYETNYASKAFTELRKDAIGALIPLIVILAGGLAFGIVKFLGYAKKKNKATSLKVGRKTYWEELLYVFHLVLHPFDGFWDLKHEKRGSVRAGSTILAIAAVAMFYNTIGQGYLFSPQDSEANVFVALLSIVLPVALWTIANWCLTTLFDGEGSLKDIYIATCYSLAPLAGTLILSTILTNILTSTEASIVTLIVAIGFIWTGILIFFGTLVTHDYPMGKNFITILGTIVAMAVIIFIVLLFGNLVMQMVSFVVSLFKEIGNRM